MESLDPIKAYECMAVTTPTVATPVPGFREHADVFDVVGRDEFPAHVVTALEEGRSNLPRTPSNWDDRAAIFERALRQAASASPTSAQESAWPLAAGVRTHFQRSDDCPG
jgi:hypothetical protein